MNTDKVHLKYTISAQSHQGMVRLNNEDNILVVPAIHENQSWMPGDSSDKYLNVFDQQEGESLNGVLLAVADGMGGANAGEVASNIAVSVIEEALSLPDFEFNLHENPKAVLFNLIHAANKKIIDYSESNVETKGMGTTMTISFINDEGGHVAWIGDSRAYLYRPNAGLRQVSKDHSVVQELLDSNQISEEIAFYHPDSHVITQSLGDSARAISPSYIRVDILEGDLLMLCTDGLNGMLMDSEIESVITNYAHADLNELTDQLIHAANDAGGNDNVSLILFNLNAGNLVETKQQTIEGQAQENPPVASVSFRNRLSLSPRRKQRKLYLIFVLLILAVVVGFLLKIYTYDQPNTIVQTPVVDSSKVLSPVPGINIQDTSLKINSTPGLDTLKTDTGGTTQKNPGQIIDFNKDTIKKK